MTKSLFQIVAASAKKNGCTDTKWLRARKEPQFELEEYGSTGPKIILLHGLLGAMSNWDATIPHMAKYSQPVAFRFPLLTGHRTEVKVMALAAYTEYYIRKENLGPVILCGNSLGGHVALRLYLAAPELVDCLILSGSSGLYEHTVDTLPVRIGDDFVRDHAQRVFYSSEFATEEVIRDIVGVLSSRMNTLNLIHAARSAKKDYLRDRLPEIKTPTLLLWGKNDHITTMQVAETFHELIPNSTLSVVDKCGHAPMIEHPEWFANEVEKFIKEHSQYYK